MRLFPTLGSFVAVAGCFSTMACSSPAPADPASNPSTTAGAGGAAAGQSGAGGAASGAGGLPAGGMSGTGGVPTAGTAGAGGGSAGTAGSAGASGSGGGGPGGPYTVPRGNSTGCGTQNLADPPGEFAKHDIDVTGVDPAYVAAHTVEGGPYNWTFRNYFIRLPVGYNENTAYPLVFGGGGCGGSKESGDGGGFDLVPDEDSVIRVGLSYMWAEGQGACFQDDGVNSPEVPYFDAVYADITANNCVNLEKVFVGGWSSGAWEAYTLGLARGGIIRGTASGAGGLRAERPEPSPVPFAMMGITGLQDFENDYQETKDGTTCSGTEAEGCFGGKIICGFPGAEDCVNKGSALARDLILQRNGCVGTETEQYGIWPDCQKYIGCPAEFPVVFCRPDDGHTSGNERLSQGAWDLWSALPPVP